MAEQQVTPKNKAAALAAAGAAKAKAAPAVVAPPAAVVPPAAAPEDDFDDGPEIAEPVAAPPVAAAVPAEPEVRTRKDDVKTRKDQKAERAKPVIQPTDDYVRDKNGAIRKDEDGDDMRLASGEHPLVGFVNENGVLFPNGFKIKGGHVQNGLVVLNRCPKCGNHQSIDEALSGSCANRKAGPEKLPCNHNPRAELEDWTLNAAK